jgi:2Fe-2S ferredoxin
MGGQNPYIQESNIQLPTRKYKIKFIDEKGAERIVEVDPALLPYEDHGLLGSLLDIAMGAGIPLDHACGGVCACSTCHVIVKEGLETCNEATEDEEDQLEEAYGLTSQSRLGCQCVPNGSRDLVVVIPSWNRNLAREPH